MARPASLSAAPSGWKEEAAITLRLAAPLVLAQLTQMAIYSTDVVMLGWLGPKALAASALAVNMFFIFNFTGTGLVLAASPLIAAALGARRHSVREARRSFRSALHVALLFSIIAWLILWNCEAILLAFGQDPELSRQAGRYMAILQWSLLPNLLILAFRGFLTALGRPMAALFATIAGLVVNAALNWMLIFGNWGAPALGLEGAAIASLVSTILMTAVLAAYIVRQRSIRRFHAFGRFWRPDFERLIAIGRIGTPIALTLAFEVSVFGAAVYLMGWIDTDSVAAHAIALQIASITFMVPLGLSQATVVRVGRAYGARDPRWIGIAGWTSLAMGVGFMAAAALTIWAFPEQLAGLFLDRGDPGSAKVLELAAGFLGIAALFQLFDGAQVVGSAMLRGLQDTRVPMLFALFGYTFVGLGSGYFLAFRGGWMGIGIWIGLALGLACVAVLMIQRWARRDGLGLTRAGPEPSPSADILAATP